MWVLWWTKWHWDRFFPQYFGFPLSVSIHWCAMTQKKLITFITSLHNKSQGCSASVASAAGSFTTQKNLNKSRPVHEQLGGEKLHWKLLTVVLKVSATKEIQLLSQN
jgi:hypothetical protein